MPTWTPQDKYDSAVSVTWNDMTMTWDEADMTWNTTDRLLVDKPTGTYTPIAKT